MHMSYRSWLVVSGNSEKKLGKAVGTGADAVVVDLANSDPLDAGQGTRQRAAEWLQAHRSHVVERHMARWVRINPSRKRDRVAAGPAGRDADRAGWHHPASRCWSGGGSPARCRAI